MISFNHTVILWTSVKISGGTMVPNPPANAGDIRDTGSISGLQRSPAGGRGNPLQYSCLENTMDRGAWWAMTIGSHRIGHN